jgi:phytoene desaturase
VTDGAGGSTAVTDGSWSAPRDALAGRSVAVVGAGFGGLSAAAYLAAAGEDVATVEP